MRFCPADAVQAGDNMDLCGSIHGGLVDKDGKNGWQHAANMLILAQVRSV
jgi:hypothetical protein